MPSLFGGNSAGAVAAGSSFPQADDLQLFLVPSHNSPFGNISIVKLPEITGAGLPAPPIPGAAGTGGFGNMFSRKPRAPATTAARSALPDCALLLPLCPRRGQTSPALRLSHAAFL